jgi:hypothetical protein
MLKDDLVDNLVKKCNRCGSYNSSDSCFCKNCGDNLEQSVNKIVNEEDYRYESTIDDTQPISLKEIEKQLNGKKLFRKIKIPKITFSRVKSIKFKLKFNIPKFRFNIPKIKFKPANNKKKIIIFASIILICFSIAAYAYSTPGTKMILSYYAQNEKSDELISYIEKNKDNVSKKELVSYGMNKILVNNLVSGINFLNEELYNEENSYDFIGWIIVQMKNSEVLPEDATKFSAFYIDKYILNNNGELETDFWNQYIELMKIYPDEDIKIGFYANISDLYLNNKLEESIKVLTALNTIKIGTDSDNETLLSLIEKTKSNTSLIEEKTIENEGIQEKIEDNLGEIEAQNLLLTDITAQVETTNSEIEELKQKLSVKQNYSYLRYYCVTKHESGVYEIILPKNSNFFGEILSNTHAIIYTSDSTLTVNGWGDLNVYDNGYKTVTLKAYGNYKQDLMTYKEVSKSDFTEIDSIQATVDENNNTLATLNESKDTYISKITELEENNTALEEEKNTLLAALTTMKNDNSSIDSQIKDLIKIK